MNASDTTAAYLRVDIKRRDVLAGTVDSPLIGLVDADTPPALRPVPDVPAALDLPDVTGDTVTGRTATRTLTPRPAASAAALTPAASGGGDDVTDWI
jgi:hypothetical protein